MNEVLLASVEQGFIFALLAIGVTITFSILDIADLSVEGTFPLGAFILVWGLQRGINPFLALLIAFIVGCLAGSFTYLLYKKLNIAIILAGILTMTILYTVNLKITGASNVPVVGYETVFSATNNMPKLVILVILALVAKLVIDWFLTTEKGYLLIVTGDNPLLVKSLGQKPDNYILLGLAVSNGLIAASGALMAQYQGFIDITMGQSMIVNALASIVIGQAFLRENKKIKITTRALIGAIIYRIIYGIAIHLGLNPDDLKAITAFIVIIFIGYNNFHNYSVRSKQLKKMEEQ